MHQQVFSDIPAGVQSADQITFFDPDIVEEGLAKRRLTGDQADRSGAGAGCCHIEQHKADAGVFLGGIGANQAENPIALIGI